MFMHLAGFRQFRLPALSLNPKASKISQHAVSCLAILVDSQMLMAMSQDKAHMDQLPHHGLPSFIALNSNIFKIAEKAATVVVAPPRSSFEPAS
jgi:glycerol-3-phosphate dehydrogenase